MTERKGKFIIIEGTDGSGKTTQLNLLKEYFENKGKKVHTLDFPQYEEFWGKLVGRFLTGEFGELDSVSPYLASIIYALDQTSQNANVNRWLDEGCIVLSNRYVTSSMAHQTCKFSSLSEQEKFLDWFMEMTYDKLNLIKEDLTVVLYAHPDISKKLASESRERKSSYIKTKEIAEDHPTHIADSAQMYKKLCDKFAQWKLIDCMNGDNIDSIENIHDKVVEIVREFE